MTYLFSENRELKNIQDNDVVVWDCGGRSIFRASIMYIACLNKMHVSFISEYSMHGVEIYTAHFTRIQTEPQTAPDIPVPCGSN